MTRQVIPTRLTAGATVVVVHALVFAALAYWSWRKWPDPLIDFGRELYLPWQITRGRVLYRDLASLFGPLSPYVNALWFTLFGSSLMTLVFCNLAIFAACVAAIHRLIASATDRVTATAASLTTLLLFGFNQYLEVGNYNFVTPYSHEATHGFALTVAMLACLHQAIRHGRTLFAAAAGVCFGLVLLTKPEVALAAAAGAAAAWVGAAVVKDVDTPTLVRGIALFFILAALPALLFFLYFLRHMEVSDALRAAGGAWTTPNSAAIVRNVFYLRGMGLDDPVENALETLQISLGFLLFVAAAAFVSWKHAGEGSRPTKATRLLRFALLAIAVLALRSATIPRALPAIAILALAGAVVMFRAARHDRQRALQLLPLVTWSVFACVLLAKLGLYARIWHYGFYLALPATVSAVALICWMIPRLLDEYRRPPAGRVFRQMALWALAVAVVPFLATSYGWYRTNVVPVASGSDRFYASTLHWHGRVVQAAHERLERSARDATLAVLPEGIMLNYLLRRDSPLRVVNLMPPEILAFGESDVVRSLQAAPPTFIVFVHRNTSEYAYPLFGTDERYGLKTMQWVRSRYRTLDVIGERPMSEAGFGIEILGRNP